MTKHCAELHKIVQSLEYIQDTNEGNYVNACNMIKAYEETQKLLDTYKKALAAEQNNCEHTFDSWTNNHRTEYKCTKCGLEK